MNVCDPSHYPFSAKGKAVNNRLRCLTTSLILMIVAPISHSQVAFAADDSSLPGVSELGEGVSVKYVASGEMTSNDGPLVRLIVERLILAEGEPLPDSDVPQIIAVQEGNLAMMDDL